MGNPDLQGAYSVLKRWYRQAPARSPSPSRVDMAKVTVDYAMLYQQEETTNPQETGINPRHTL